MAKENKQDQGLDAISRKGKYFGCLAILIIFFAFGLILSRGDHKETAQQVSNNQPAIEKTAEEPGTDIIVEDEEYEVPNIIKSIPEGKRKEIYFALISVMDKAMEEAKLRVMPKAGDEIILEKEMRIIPTSVIFKRPEYLEQYPSIQQAKTLKPGMKIKILQVVMDQNDEYWFYVQWGSDKGWVREAFLQMQFNQLDTARKESDISDEIQEELKKSILKEYHITEEQLDQIFYEGINKKW